MFVSLITLVMWSISFAGIVFIPLDIYLSRRGEETSDIHTEEHYLYSYWALSYWLSYFFNWIVIPIIQGFVISGEFSFTEKLLYAITYNVPFYIAYFVSFIILLILLFIIDSENDT